MSMGGQSSVRRRTVACPWVDMARLLRAAERRRRCRVSAARHGKGMTRRVPSSRFLAWQNGGCGLARGWHERCSRWIRIEWGAVPFLE
jgi:hypothetical protein